MSPLAYALFMLMGIAFYELFMRLQVLGDIRRVFKVAPAATRIIRSDTMSDAEKEVAVRQMSLIVLKDTLMFTGKLALILGVVIGMAALGQFLFTLSADGLSALLFSWQALVVMVLFVAAYAHWRKRRALPPPDHPPDHPGGDR